MADMTIRKQDLFQTIAGLRDQPKLDLLRQVRTMEAVRVLDPSLPPLVSEKAARLLGMLAQENE
jgi:hypothetical protein